MSVCPSINNVRLCLKHERWNDTYYLGKRFINTEIQMVIEELHGQSSLMTDDLSQNSLAKTATDTEKMMKDLESALKDLRLLMAVETMAIDQLFMVVFVMCSLFIRK